MSVHTAADDALDKAAEHIHEAILNLNRLLVEQCWGHDEYSAEYDEKVQRAFNDLIRIRKDLNR